MCVTSMMEWLCPSLWGRPSKNKFVQYTVARQHDDAAVMRAMNGYETEDEILPTYVARLSTWGRSDPARRSRRGSERDSDHTNGKSNPNTNNNNNGADSSNPDSDAENGRARRAHSAQSEDEDDDDHDDEGEGHAVADGPVDMPTADDADAV
eukprot:m.120296 g.120296  ORF g.120296 m.120296 type:complete len:152 (+) comp16174_c0_seq2:81-536(+)